MPSNGRHPIIDRQILATSRTIAKGRGIRDIERLVQTYGGKARDWMKKSSAPMVIDGQMAEIHWYECHGVGRFEIKIKQVQR